MLCFPFAKVLAMFSHFSNDLVCFANILESQSGLHNMKTILSAVDPPVVISKSKMGTDKELAKTQQWIELSVESTSTLTRWERRCIAFVVKSSERRAWQRW